MHGSRTPTGMLRSRRGCLGCVPQLLAVLLLTGLVVLAATAFFAPWGFFLGGPFHIIPYWQGWGRLHSSLSGDYALYLRMEPAGATRLGSAYLSGVGYLCTPRGERIRLELVALMGRHLELSTDGQAISIDLYHRPALTWNFNPERRPRIDLHGRWRNPNLVLDDHGSFSRAFLKDGSINLGALPAARETVPITISPGSWSEFEQACAVRR